MPALGLGYSMQDSQDQGGSLGNVNLHVRAKVASLVSNSLQPCGLYSLPGSSVHGISEARILDWVVILFSRGSSWSRDRIQVSCIASGFFIDLATRKAGKNVLHCVTQWWKIVLGARNHFYLMNILTHITHSKEYLAFQISVNGIPFIQGDLKS